MRERNVYTSLIELFRKTCFSVGAKIFKALKRSTAVFYFN